MARRLLALSVLAILFAVAATGLAQQPAGSQNNQRLIHPIKYGNAGDLAELLGKHFKGGDQLQILADPASNSLLINAPPAAVKEILEHAKQLDRQPRRVALDVIIVDITGKKGEDGKPVPLGMAFEPREFQGPAEIVLHKLAGLKKKGLINDIKHLELKATENQSATVKDSTNKPYVTGTQVIAAGKGGVPQVRSTVGYRMVGSMVEAKVRIPDANSLLVELKVEDSRMHTPEDGVALGQDETGKPIRATEFVVTTTVTRLNLTPGDAMALEAVKTESRTGQAQMLILLVARLVDDGN